MDFDLSLEIKEVYNDLKATEITSPARSKKMLNSAVGRGRTVARQATYKNGIKKNSGDLKKATISKTFRKGGNIEGYILNRSVQAANLEFGGAVRPRIKKYLVFNIDGHMIKTKIVHIPGGQLGFFRSQDKYWGSNEPAARMEKVLTRDLEKIWGKQI